MSDRLMAVDPGKMTGWALWDRERQKFVAGELGWFEFLMVFEQRASSDAGLFVVSESFIITPATVRKSREHWSLEAIGAMKYILQRQGLPDLVLQSPAQGKSFGTDDKLKALDWWIPGKGHAMDAARHLLVHLMKDPRSWNFDPSPLVSNFT
jgi:hypothetical protein